LHTNIVVVDLSDVDVTFNNARKYFNWTSHAVHVGGGGGGGGGSCCCCSCSNSKSCTWNTH